jgi:hypothetical protein
VNRQEPVNQPQTNTVRPQENNNSKAPAQQNANPSQNNRREKQQVNVKPTVRNKNEKQKESKPVQDKKKNK